MLKIFVFSISLVLVSATSVASGPISSSHCEKYVTDATENDIERMGFRLIESQYATKFSSSRFLQELTKYKAVGDFAAHFNYDNDFKIESDVPGVSSDEFVNAAIQTIAEDVIKEVLRLFGKNLVIVKADVRWQAPNEDMYAPDVRVPAEQLKSSDPKIFHYDYGYLYVVTSPVGTPTEFRYEDQIYQFNPGQLVAFYGKLAMEEGKVGALHRAPPSPASGGRVWIRFAFNNGITLW